MTRKGSGMARDRNAPLDHFSELRIDRPSDLIIRQIGQLISSGKLNPGMRLPSERDLSERFGVGRGSVRDAIKILEFYGILQTLPKSGTLIAPLGVKSLDGIISTILHIDGNDFRSVFETRAVLETHSARAAAIRASDEDRTMLRRCHEDFQQEIARGNHALDEDHTFHLKIAEASRNTLLGSFIGLITPDIIKMNRNFHEEDAPQRRGTMEEHERILQAIDRGDGEGAAAAMQRHMDAAFRRRFGEGAEGILMERSRDPERDGKRRRREQYHEPTCRNGPPAARRTGQADPQRRDPQHRVRRLRPPGRRTGRRGDLRGALRRRTAAPRSGTPG